VSDSQKPSAAILGGSAGGLSVSHELAEPGFRVAVYERQPIFGGKARRLIHRRNLPNAFASRPLARLPPQWLQTGYWI
jgi:heterodisulfide reductase subunit A-like polyferredoxin